MRLKAGSKASFSGIALVVALSSLLFAWTGCHRVRPTGPPVPPHAGKEPAVAGSREMKAADTAPAVSVPAAMPAVEPPVPEAPRGDSAGSPAAPPPEFTAGTREPAAVVLPGPPEAVAPPIPRSATKTPREPANAVAPHPGEAARNGKTSTNGASALDPEGAAPNEPAWASGKEELAYRVEFLGMTMGYARFAFKGKVTYNGKEVYHLNVRAWTSDFLSVIYPVNDTIDYYLDVKTLAPLRQEYTREGKKKDDIAFYDEEKGKIVYRYKSNGEVRKRVDVPQGVHDPVSAAFYFRTRDLGEEGRPRNVYAGRKLWQISTRTLGMEKIDTPGGPVDTVVIQPVIRRDGNPENKGDLKMWMTNDARHVPVKIYAKFRKIKMWTLTAELVPQKGG